MWACNAFGEKKMQEGDCLEWGDFGIDQYVSWNLTNEEFTLDVIWEKF